VDDDVEIRDAREEARYELRVGGARVGTLTYRAAAGRITLVHTGVDDEYSRRGLGTRLARFALDDARSRGLAVIPACPFVSAIIRGHPDEYLDEVVPAMRKRVMQEG
jgi:uncharacterized protein